MTTNTLPFATGASHFVQAFGTTAHSAIDALRAGGDRLGDLASARWDSAFREASPRLSAQSRRNASNARKVFSRYYRKGLDWYTGGAVVVVDTLVQTCDSAIGRTARRA